MFIDILRRKAENAGGKVDEFSTKTTKLSQYCHKCGKYTKKPISQRVHTCCDLNIQRDLYSAFLASSVVENKLDTADVINNPPTPRNFGGRWRSMEAILQRTVSKLTKVANGRQLSSSVAEVAKTSEDPNSWEFGYDRATRPRSSDAGNTKAKPLHYQQPDAKNRDVVAVQLWLF